jgi:hypothetical protein
VADARSFTGSIRRFALTFAVPPEDLPLIGRRVLEATEAVAVADAGVGVRGARRTATPSAGRHPAASRRS